MSKDPQDDNLFAADLVEIIQHSKLFSEIDRTACETLLPRLERITLKQGQILFEQGDVSDCLYLLVDGQLMASIMTTDGKQKVVGTIEKGETVGELGAISNQSRSLTIRAAIDSRLLKFPRSEFEKFTREQPKIVSRIIDLIISRSQTTIKLISEKRIYQHVAIVQGDRHAPLDKLMDKLKENFSADSIIGLSTGNESAWTIQERDVNASPSWETPIVKECAANRGVNLKNKFLLIEDLSHNKPLNQLIDEAEREDKSVIFVLDQFSISHLSSKINHIGAIYIIVDGDIPGELSDFAIKMLGRHQTPFTTQYELVLLHDDHVDKPSNTLDWLKQADFTLHHHIKLNDDKAYQRLLRYMMGKAIGVVFGGGGGKGWVSLGTLMALHERNIPIDAVGGTSAGAALAGCYANRLTYEATADDYTALVAASSKPFSFTNLTWPLISIISGKSATDTLKNIFNNIQVEDLWIPYFAISANLSSGQECVHRTGNLWEVIRASAAVPGVAPPMVIHGELYYDGGLLNNLPVDQMRQLIGSESLIIAVCLTGRGENRQLVRYNFPPALPFRIGLLKKLHLAYKEYNFPPYFNTFLQALLLGSSSREKANQLKADVLICPDMSRYSLFDISIKLIETLTEVGYSTTHEQLDKNPIFSTLYKRK